MIKRISSLVKNTVAKITQTFVDMASSKEHLQVWESPTGKKHIKVYCIVDELTDEGPEGYFYTERNGKDSVAFILVDREKEAYQFLQQWHGPTNQFNLGAFTGSREIEKSLNAIETIIAEVEEEAGYTVTSEDVTLLGSYLVSGNSNESVDLAIVDVTGKEQELKNPENVFEENTVRYWLKPDQAFKALKEWKGLVCLMKDLANQD